MNKRMVVSERNGSESKNKFRIISIIIAMAMAVGAFGGLVFTTNSTATPYDDHAYSTALHIEGTSYGTQTNYQMLLTVHKGIGINSPGVEIGRTHV